MAKTNDLFSLEGKVAIVTGGAGIIGSKIVKGFLSVGAKVAIFDCDEKALKDLSQELLKEFTKEQFLPVGCDLTKKIDIEKSVQLIVQNWGKIDILHNNAAGKGNDLKKFFAPFEDFDLDYWRSIMANNLDSMMLMAQCVGRQMTKQGTGGSIIQTSSVYGVVAPDPRIYEGSDYLGGAINTPAVYAASKGAVLALTKYLATYWAGKKIRVNAITPGGVASGQNTTFSEKYSNRVPLGRMAEADEMVGAVVYLASSASSYVTGQNIIVDGGLTAW